MLGRIGWASLARNITRVGWAERGLLQLLAWLLFGLWLIYQILPAGPPVGRGAPESAVATQGKDDAQGRHGGETLSRRRPEGNASDISASEPPPPRQDDGAKLAQAVGQPSHPAPIAPPASNAVGKPEAPPSAPHQATVAPVAHLPGTNQAVSAARPQVPPPASSDGYDPSPGTPVPNIVDSAMAVDTAPDAPMPGEPNPVRPKRGLTQEEVDAIMNSTRPPDQAIEGTDPMQTDDAPQ